MADLKLQEFNRPRVVFNKAENIVTVYCTPELYEVFASMSGENSGANDMFVLLKAMKQVKTVLLNSTEKENS